MTASEKPTFYSQIGQDQRVVEIYQGKRDGYFVDIGAWDGVAISNSVSLERSYGWKGICVEALPAEFELCKKNRECICIQAAAYSTSGLVLDFVVSEVLSGIRENIDCYLNVKTSDKSISVTTKTVTEMLDENGAPNFIEYLSIDTEGSEFEVLKGIDFSKYSFGYVTIEHNNVEPRRSNMRGILLENGYVYLGENHCDDNYVNSRFEELTGLPMPK
jgi:FkbM family methyltransferase